MVCKKRERKRAKRHFVGVCVACVFLCEIQKAHILLCDRGKNECIACLCVSVSVLRQTSTLGQYVID